MPTINANRTGSAIGVGSSTFSTARQSNASSVTDNPSSSDANAIQHFSPQEEAEVLTSSEECLFTLIQAVCQQLLKMQL